MRNKRNKYSSKFKLQVITELINGHKTQSQITSEYWIHPNQQNRWKQQFMENAETIFEDKKEENTKEKENVKVIEYLYSKLWKVTMEKSGWKKLENCLTYSEKVKLIEKDKKELSINKQSELLWISKSSLYYEKQISDKEKQIMDRID